MVIYIDGVRQRTAPRRVNRRSTSRTSTTTSTSTARSASDRRPRSANGRRAIDRRHVHRAHRGEGARPRARRHQCGGGITTITPKLYGEFLVAANYKENVRAVCRLGGSSAGIVAIEFDWALLIVETVTGQSAGNGTVKLKFEARQAANAASLGVAPYSIKVSDTLANIVTPDP
jgi:hypothetical protein